jgi:potassium-transporting ATPase KdpC subunit
MRQTMIAIRITLLLAVLTGALYPALVTGLAKLLFPQRASGSFVPANGRTVGSSLIGQRFTRPGYFHGRPSAAGNDGYDASASGGSNLGPTSRKLIDRVRDDARKFRAENPEFSGPLPADLLTASASGLDPHISPASAEAQVARVARARGVPADQVLRVVAEQTEPRQLGILGEPRVNVLLLNLALDRRFPPRK